MQAGWSHHCFMVLYNNKHGPTYLHKENIFSALYIDQFHVAYNKETKKTKLDTEVSTSSNSKWSWPYPSVFMTGRYLQTDKNFFFFPPEYNIHSDEYISRRGVKLSKSESYVPSGKQMMSTVTASLKSVMKWQLV